MTNGEASALSSLTRAPQLDVVALAEEHHRELSASELGAVEVPDVDRQDDVAAGGAQRAGLLAEEQDHLRARIGEIDEARPRDLRVGLPAVLELVARGLRERIADLPEALHEAVALMRLRQREEGLALGIRDQQRDLLEEAAVAVGHRGRAGRGTGAGGRGVRLAAVLDRAWAAARDLSGAGRHGGILRLRRRELPGAGTPQLLPQAAGGA